MVPSGDVPPRVLDRRRDYDDGRVCFESVVRPVDQIDHFACCSRISYIREHDGACVIGLKLFATAGMLSGLLLLFFFLLAS
jgi:hypothetical protein